MGLKDKIKGITGKARGKYQGVQEWREQRETARHEANVKKLERLKVKEKRVSTELSIKKKEEKIRKMRGSKSRGGFGSGKGLELALGGGPGPNDPFAGFMGEPKKKKKKKKRKKKTKKITIEIK